LCCIHYGDGKQIQSLWQTDKRKGEQLTYCLTPLLLRVSEFQKTYLSSKFAHDNNRTTAYSAMLSQVTFIHTHTHTHTYLLILIGSDSYELGFREGAVHDHSMGTSNAHYVNLGFILVQRVQHYLLNWGKKIKRSKVKHNLSQVKGNWLTSMLG
jgi:hypothetical protein